MPIGSTVQHTWDAENAIHHIRFLASSRQAIEDWIRVMDHIYAGLTDADHVRLMLDGSQSGTLPLTPALNRGRQWAQSLKAHPQARVALLLPDNRLRPLANSLLGLLRMGHLKIHLFEPAQRDEAIAWLCEGAG